jgi:hypothetical protein
MPVLRTPYLLHFFLNPMRGPAVEITASNIGRPQVGLLAGERGSLVIQRSGGRPVTESHGDSLVVRFVLEGTPDPVDLSRIFEMPLTSPHGAVVLREPDQAIVYPDWPGLTDFVLPFKILPELDLVLGDTQALSLRAELVRAGNMSGTRAFLRPSARNKKASTSV